VEMWKYENLPAGRQVWEMLKPEAD